MPISAEKIAQMELALAEARAELMQEDGKRYTIIMREIAVDEKQRILDGLTDRKERILFGLEPPERTERPGKSGGDLSCPLCDKTGLTKRGLALHMVRMHRGVDVNKALSEQAMAETEGVLRRSKPQGSGESTEDMFQPAQAGARRRGSRLQDTAEESEE